MSLSASTQLNSQPISELLPGLVEGWAQQGTDKLYTPETLYDYIDGGAELYLSYGMKEVVSRIIDRGDDEIRIEIFDMIEPKNAFGVFTHSRTKNEKQFGQGSQYFTGAQIFWKDRYFISITANDENEIIVAAINSIATEIDSKITSTGQVPDIINMLPEEGLEPDGYLYFHHYIWMNSYFYIANDNLLNIGNDTDALLVKYGPQNNRHYLLIIKYPNTEIAAKAEDTFKEQFIRKDDSVDQIDDGTWLGVKTIQQYLIAVFNATDKNSLLSLIKETEAKITNP